jgi:uncharacterized protein (DUF342 family)
MSASNLQTIIICLKFTNSSIFYNLIVTPDRMPHNKRKLSISDSLCKKKALLKLDVDFRSGRSLSAGRAVSLLVASLLRGLTCPAAPAGVERPPLQSTVVKNQHSPLT